MKASPAVSNLRIAYVKAGTGLGGLEKHTLDLSSEVASLGHTVAVFASGYIKNLVDPNVQHINIDFERSRYNPFLLYDLWIKLKNFNPNIIHAQAGKAAEMVGLIRRFLGDCCTVTTIHNDKSKNKMVASFDARIAVSNNIKTLLSPLTSKVIFNGIKPIRRVQTDISHWNGLVKGPRILAVGRLVPAKGFDVLVEAMKNIDASLVIAGSGKEQKNISKLIDKANLNNKIRLLGQRDDVYSLMQSADMLVISSKKEGGPIVLLEALEIGLPVVSTNVGIVPELIPEEFISDKCDPLSLSSVINRSIKDLDSTKEKFKKVFSDAKPRISLRKMAKETLDLYNDVLQTKK